MRKKSFFWWIGSCLMVYWKLLKKRAQGELRLSRFFDKFSIFYPIFDWASARCVACGAKFFGGSFSKKRGKNRPSRGAKIGVRRISGLKAKSLRESDFDYAILVSPPKHFALLSQNRANFARSSSTNPIIRVCSPDQTFGGGKNRRIWLKKRSRTSVCYHGGYPRKGS